MREITDQSKEALKHMKVPIHTLRYILKHDPLRGYDVETLESLR